MLLIIPLLLTSCARLILGNEIVNEMSSISKDMRQLLTDNNGLLFVAGKFASKNKRWPKDADELKKFWSDPRNITDQSAYRNLRLINLKNGGLKMTWEDKNGGTSSLELGRISKVTQQ